jgi:hypothetical protein
MSRSPNFPQGGAEIFYTIGSIVIVLTPHKTACYLKMHIPASGWFLCASDRDLWWKFGLIHWQAGSKRIPVNPPVICGDGIQHE